VYPENVSNLGSKSAGKNTISATNIENMVGGLEVNAVDTGVGKARSKAGSRRVGLVAINERE
jgi:cytidine deaminase